MRAREPTRPAAARAAVAIALAVAIIAMLLGARRTDLNAPVARGAPRVYDASAGPPRPRTPRRPASASATSAAHRFALDYAETLLGARSSRRVRHATARLKTDIARAGLRAPVDARGDDEVRVQLRTRRITPTVVGVRGVARASDYVAHLSFLITATTSGWVVDTLADPDDPAG